MLVNDPLNVLMRSIKSQQACPATERLKSPEELAKEQLQREQREEQLRVQRMQPDFQEQPVVETTGSIETLDTR